MIHSIVAYGDPVLKKKAIELDKDTVDVKKLSEEMFETMYKAKGVGLAAPQIGLNYRMFVVDSTPFIESEEEEDDDDDSEQSKNNKGFKAVFINPVIIEEWGKEWSYEEGCLSIPGIRGDVYRLSNLKIKYSDQNWIEHTIDVDGFVARIIQHEYDHIEGILFVDHLPALKRQLIKNKLVNISKGNTDVSYRMKFPLKK